MNKIDQHIKEKLSQPQVPPLDAWKNIQEQLDKKEEKKRAIPLFYWIGSTAACLIVGVGIFYFNQNDTQKIDQPRQVVKYSNTLQKNKNVQPKESLNNSVDNDNPQSESYHDESFSKLNQHSKSENSTSNFYSNQSIDSKKLNENNSSFSIKNDMNLVESIIKENEKSTQKINENSVKNKLEINDNKENIEEKSLELVINEEKKKVEKKVELKNSSPKFAVSSFVSPAKMVDSKSILSDEFNRNDINNMVTVAYGAKVSVKVNDRINVRSGISKIDLEQRTSNVASAIPTEIVSLYAAASSSANHQNNIAYNSNMRVSALPQKNAAMTVSKTENSRMEQKIQYVEVPLEVEYKLLNLNKFNLLATGGGSYYLLTKNSISLTTLNNKVNQKIGEATNLNDNSYSLNTGLKLEYNFSHKTSLNLEPNYRYMLNPINNVSAKNPSLLGVNIGFSIKF